MNNLSDLLLNAIDRYITHLTQFGKINLKQSDALSVLTFIHDILTGPMNEFVTEEDYRVLEGMLYCMEGRVCLVPYSSCTFANFPISLNLLSNI